MTIAGKALSLTLAFISGVSMAIQGSLNSVLGKAIGLWEATLIVHATASLSVLAILFVFHLGNGNFGLWWKAPWYTYLGGVIGVIITYGVVASIPRVGVALATTIIIVGQVGMAALIDHFGLFGLKKIPFTWLKLAGLVLLAAGAWLMLNQSKS